MNASVESFTRMIPAQAEPSQRDRVAYYMRNALGGGLLLLLDVLQAPLSGMVFAILWDWFAVPFGVRAISPEIAVGLACLFGVVRCALFGTYARSGYSVALGYAKPVLYLAIGYVAHQYLLRHGVHVPHLLP